MKPFQRYWGKAVQDQERFTDKIYEAALIPELWPSVLDELAKLAGGIGTILFASTGNSTRWISSESTHQVMEKFVADGWMDRNTRAARLLNYDFQGFVTDLDVYTREELEQDPVYREALRPVGLGWGAATAIPAPSGELLVFSIERKFSDGPVERHRLAALDAARPHLARAALLSSRLVFERAKLIVETLNMLGLPAAVIDSSRRVIAHNDMFLTMAPQIQISARNVVSVTDLKARSLFEEAVKTFSLRTSSGCSLPLSAIDSSPPAVLHVLPLRGDARDVFSGATGLLLINPIDTRAVPSVKLLQGLFDLSPGEARVAKAILAGGGVKSAAGQLGISDQTVRTHLKAIFAKTGQNSQASLLALLSGSAKYEPTPGKIRDTK
ncbi:helix-turn-helix transcriptional regulator [Mesorhizobium australicum]|uniref:helix-turn-helix transcriptional regulator n=1 Tax=Mesorhizobium australicum TaxID=536018 RepID=UPI001FCCE668|nr:LuxR C-terminal-related transcriptional regulator [Mesorhizobium australicum]